MSDHAALNSVTIQEFEPTLAAQIAAVEDGQEVLITRDGRPVARLTAVVAAHCVVGDAFRRHSFRPVVRGGLGGRGLELLDEDRRDRLDEHG